MNVLASHCHPLSCTASVQKTHSKALGKHMEREQEYKVIPIYLHLSLHVCVHKMCVLLSVYADCDVWRSEDILRYLLCQGSLPTLLETKSLYCSPLCVPG